MGGRSHFGKGATTNSGVSVTLALMEFAMKHSASTLSMALRQAQFDFALEGDTGSDRDSGDMVLPVYVLEQAFSFAFISDRGHTLGLSQREDVYIMHVLREPTSSSSGAQMSGSPLNSGGLPTTMFGLPAAESIPRRAELQAVLAL